MAEYYVGTLSGTSADGIDVVLADFADEKPRLVAANTYPIPDTVRTEIRALSTPTDNEIERLGRLDVTLGRLIAAAVNELLAEAGVANSEVIAIGSHGQTLRHRPDADPPFTLQVGDPNTIAARTSITTVADFRRMDMALGGQGAPLAPVFHAALFQREGANLAILNIGGIANLTLLPGDRSGQVTGFDCGPGNCLMDEWTQKHLGLPYDRAGEWAAGGNVNWVLLQKLMKEPYFERPYPKSTGREIFNLTWLHKQLEPRNDSTRDIQATLAELTAFSVAHALRNCMPSCNAVYVCGGGSDNDFLMARLSANLEKMRIEKTTHLGMDPMWVEGSMFAWLARAHAEGTQIQISNITGAEHNYITGARYQP
jgi:anhydro-N-acetylmuramic acid kinase